ncbi:hypothetical protein [Gemmatimonas sp.]|uniref:hypothetical protein n=1 Tax=Gemmatimonas sp. TaxID=1962908 RepID=UPI0031C1E316|nr:hypothetical protein [Gemmatimonas sp.]
MTAETGTPHEAERWLGIQDDLLRGLAHAISNRLATIIAAAGVLDVPETPDPRFLDGLRSDADRLDGLLTLLRQLPRRADADLEPLLLSDALETARRLVNEHPDLRGRTITPVFTGDVVPARAEPTAVLHAMIVALLGASRGGAGPITVAMETVGDCVRVGARVDGGGEEAGDDAIEDDARTISWLLRSSNGRGTTLAGGCAFEVPTLQASRRRPG